MRRPLRRFGWAVGLAAALLVLVLVGGIAWLVRSAGEREAPVITETQAPTTTLPSTTVPPPTVADPDASPALDEPGLDSGSVDVAEASGAIALGFAEDVYSGDVEAALQRLAFDATVGAGWLPETYLAFVAAMNGIDPLHEDPADETPAAVSDVRPLVEGILHFAAAMGTTYDSAECDDYSLPGHPPLAAAETRCTMDGTSRMHADLGLDGPRIVVHVDVQKQNISYLSVALDPRQMRLLGEALWTAFPEEYEAACAVTGEAQTAFHGDADGVITEFHFIDVTIDSDRAVTNPGAFAQACGQFISDHYDHPSVSEVLGSPTPLRHVDEAAREVAESTARTFADSARAGDIATALELLGDEVVITGAIYDSWEANHLAIGIDSDRPGLKGPAPTDRYVVADPADPILELLAGSLTFDAVLETSVDSVTCNSDDGTYLWAGYRRPLGPDELRCTIFGTNAIERAELGRPYGLLVVQVDVRIGQITLVSPAIPGIRAHEEPGLDDELYRAYPDEFESTCSVRARFIENPTGIGRDLVDIVFAPATSLEPVAHADACGTFIMDHYDEFIG